MMLAFDRPISFSTFGKRNTTNVPAQSLMLMNDPFVAEQAEVMAKRVMLSQYKPGEMYSVDLPKSFGRRAKEEEVTQATAFLQQQAQAYQVQSEDLLQSVEVWKDYCHMIFNTKEFIYLI